MMVSKDVSQTQAPLDRIQSKDSVIGVVRPGYAGLPLCVAFGEAGAKSWNGDAAKLGDDLVRPIDGTAYTQNGDRLTPKDA